MSLGQGRAGAPRSCCWNPPELLEGSSRLKSAGSTVCYDNQSLLGDIRKAMGTMEESGVSLERRNKTQMFQHECEHLINLA
ncbi:hypothetical protein L1987_52161 [Smallanthus sonchifolius]|uniref:Uncharacterized protein n=1 Tax=Smallanthus sonchifolius TaxID=185202 RepID=A0ACB9ESM6_9ASTR|nr:hypothetical protein L1987_52161 [Smallanthus sonchifolius]